MEIIFKVHTKQEATFWANSYVALTKQDWTTLSDEEKQNIPTVLESNRKSVIPPPLRRFQACLESLEKSVDTTMNEEEFKQFEERVEDAMQCSSEIPIENTPAQEWISNLKDWKCDEIDNGNIRVWLQVIKSALQIPVVNPGWKQGLPYYHALHFLLDAGALDILGDDAREVYLSLEDWDARWESGAHIVCSFLRCLEGKKLERDMTAFYKKFQFTVKDSVLFTHGFGDVKQLPLQMFCLKDADAKVVESLLEQIQSQDDSQMKILLVPPHAEKVYDLLMSDLKEWPRTILLFAQEIPLTFVIRCKGNEFIRNFQGSLLGETMAFSQTLSSAKELLDVLSK